MKSKAIVIGLVLLFLLSTAAVSEPARMVLVLDGSGSMWGQIDGTAKIAIAKAVMAELIDQIPTDFETGLIVYGHRRKGDCNDIEMLIPVGPHNPAAMKAKVQAISPKGKTPLSEAVRQAAQALRYTEERATVVLVSDGLETCDVDPCQLAAELAMSGVDFTVHVIGFDISQEDQARLRCLADKTGGLFLAAGSAGALRDALFTTVEKAKEPPPPVVEDPGTATLIAPSSVPAGLAFKVQWEGPDSRDDFIAIAEKGSKDLHYRDYTYTKKGNPAYFVAPGDVGDYELRYVHTHTRKVIGRAEIKVTPVQASVQAPASSDVAVEFEVLWQGPAYPSDYISVARPDQRPGSYVDYTYTRDGSPLKVRAPSEPGTYEVRYILGHGDKLLAKAAIEIKGVGASLDAPPVADVATAFEVAWQGPGNKEDYISVARPDQRSGSYVNYTYAREGSPLKVRAPSEPGTYEVRYILGRGNKLLAKTTIEIKAVTAGVQAAASADMATEFEVAWQGPGNKEDYISVARPDQRPGSYVNYTYVREGSPLKVRAPSEAGTYEVRYILGRGDKLLAKTTIEIKAVTAGVQAAASADMATEFEVAWQGPGNKEDYISVARPDQRPGSYVNYTYVREGSPLKVRAPSEAGTYEVRYILGRGDKLLAKTTIEIKAVTAKVTAPASTKAGEVFEVTWQGPDNKSDYISIARPDQRPQSYKGYTYTSKGNPVKVKAPKEPGTYEVRYILNRGNKLLAKTTIEITP
jgi:Ca-activated chloride channel family protein